MKAFNTIDELIETLRKHNINPDKLPEEVIRNIVWDYE